MTAERIGIVGLGLIGGSLAQALGGRRGSPEVWGCDRKASHLRMALADGAIARAATEAEIASCDLVVLCVPVIRSLELIRRIGPRMRPGTVLTDTGSVKAEIVRVGRRAMARGAEFVGGHPIAGTENSGYPAADGRLFRGRTAVLTPTAANGARALRRVERLWETAGARVIRMDVRVHDRVFASVSHLPHAVAYTLVHAVATRDAGAPLGYSAGGFRDFTRIASSNPLMWKDIVIQNRREVLRAMGHFRKDFARLAALIRARDEEGLVGYFRRAKAARDRLSI